MRPRTILLAVLAAAFATLFTSFGFWQLRRLEGRRASNAHLARRLAAAPVPFESLPPSPADAEYRRVRVAGRLDYARELVLPGRAHQGSPGVHLLTPLLLPGRDTAVLVNRGWVYSPDGATVDLARWRVDGDREPGDSLAAAASFTGVARVVPRGGRSLVAADSRRPYLLRPFDLAAVAGRLPYPVAAVYVAALPDDPEAAPNADAPARIAQPSLGEGPHLGYAVQWFSFAAIAVVGFAVFLRRERRDATGVAATPRPPVER
jgi:surfeit locus 1 family protein